MLNLLVGAARALADDDVAEALASTDGPALAREVLALSPSQVQEVRALLSRCGAGPAPVPAAELSDLRRSADVSLPPGRSAVTRTRLGDRAPTGVPRPARDLHRAGPADASGGPGRGTGAVRGEPGRPRRHPERAGRRRLRADREQRRGRRATGARRPARRPAADDRPRGGARRPVRRHGPSGHRRSRRSGPSRRTSTASPRPATGSPTTCRTPTSWSAPPPARPPPRWPAARSTPRSARRWPREQFGLEILADDVADNAGAVTRFVLLAPPGPPPDADRPRPHDARRHHAEPPRLAARAAHRAGRARHRPHAHRVAPDQGPARRVLVPPRLHRPHRRARDGRGAGGAAPALRPGALPRLLPAGRERERPGVRRRRAGRSRARHRRRRRSRPRSAGSPACASGART